MASKSLEALIRQQPEAPVSEELAVCDVCREEAECGDNDAVPKGWATLFAQEDADSERLICSLECLERLVHSLRAAHDSTE